MNRLVKIKWSIDDGWSPDDPEFIFDETTKFWHLIVNEAGCDMTFCEGQVFDYGDTNATYETKETERGGITCPTCLSKIRAIKAVKL